MKLLINFVFIVGLINGCMPTYLERGGQIRPDDLKVTPDLDLNCDDITVPVYSSSPNNKRSISTIDSTSATEMVKGDPLQAIIDQKLCGDSGSDVHCTNAIIDDFGTPYSGKKALKFNPTGSKTRQFKIPLDRSSLVLGDIVFISFYVKTLSINPAKNISNGTTLAIDYHTNADSKNELDRMIVTVPLTNNWQRVYFSVQTYSLNKTGVINEKADFLEIKNILGFEQEYLIGGFSVKNYKNQIPFLEFPTFDEYYQGMEDSAQWHPRCYFWPYLRL